MEWIYTITSLFEWKLQTFLRVIDLQNEQNIFLSNIYNVIPMLGVSFLSTNVSARALKIPPS